MQISERMMAIQGDSKDMKFQMVLLMNKLDTLLDTSPKPKIAAPKNSLKKPSEEMKAGAKTFVPSGSGPALGSRFSAAVLESAHEREESCQHK